MCGTVRCWGAAARFRQFSRRVPWVESQNYAGEVAWFLQTTSLIGSCCRCQCQRAEQSCCDHVSGGDSPPRGFTIVVNLRGQSRFVSGHNSTGRSELRLH